MLVTIKQLQEGLVLYIDYNEDKQLTVETKKENSALVYMDTISMIVSSFKVNVILYFSKDPFSM